ncbi:hypothetical protein BH24CHL9_BH24CHL9_15290 [soil metagenome]
MSHHPIADLAFLSDCHSAALVDRTGSVDWWCLPSFASPSVFGRILDEGAGHFRVAPAETVRVERAYLDDSLVLRTTFHTTTGSLELTDALAMGPCVRGHELGTGSPHVLLRHARCTDGRVPVEAEFSPRFEYGLTTPLVSAVEGGVVATGGPTTLRLSSSIPLEVDGTRAIGSVTLSAGETAAFAVHGTSTWEALPEPWSAASIDERVADTTAAWRSWAGSHQGYAGPYA